MLSIVAILFMTFYVLRAALCLTCNSMAILYILVTVYIIIIFFFTKCVFFFVDAVFDK